MSAPFDQFALLLQVDQHAALFAARHDEIELARNRFQAAHLILFRRFFQIREAGRGVVEVRDRLIQPLRQVREVRLEVAERRRRLISLSLRFKDVVRARILHKHIAAEEIPRRVAPVRFAVDGVDHFESAAAGGGVGGALVPDFRADMAGHPQKVVHQLLRRLEHIGVHPLDDVVQQRAALVERDLKGVVDVAGSIRDRDHEVAVELEAGGELPEIEFHNHFSFC